ncbi:MAG: gamma-glutamyltransferase family protein [Planctomycetota bacterium]|nr:gamma-glutamyltransferase family protein [Planctomycetota bacterium]
MVVSASFDWTLPYSSSREPACGRAVVATSVPAAASAGLDILRRGGNAIDAAVATAACMTVVEPTTNGLGGDAFALVWDGTRVHGFNGSGRSPAGFDAAMLEGQTRFPRLGWTPVTVPGEVALWRDLSHRLGRLPFADLMAPAIEFAERGFPLSPQTADLWNRAATTYASRPDWCETFLFEGRPPRAGEIVRLPGHARALRAIAESNGEAFYTGEIAAAALAEGGALRASDLAAHETLEVEPISVGYRGARLHEIPPNGQGIAALVALGVLRSFDLPSLDPECPDVLHLQIEAVKLGFADAHRHVADPRFVDRAPAELLAPERLRELADRIDPAAAQTFDAGTPRPGGTILLCAADDEGRCVSFIQSNYTGFGSGVVVPGWGIAMQNRGACFHLDPTHPNAAAPGKRPYHTIIPALATPIDPAAAPSEGLMAFGVMGGFMQPQGHLQVLSRVRDHLRNPQAALDAPRFQWTSGRSVMVEPGFPDATLADLESRGHQLKRASTRSVTFGRGQAIHALGDGNEVAWCAGSDPRADGQAAAW